MNIGGEIINLSFGPAANAVTSHFVNLQGLAGTSSSSHDDDNHEPLCDPYLTHAVYKDTYVPRVLFVDCKNNFNPWPDEFRRAQGDARAEAWTGKVELQQRVIQFDETTRDPSSYNSNSYEYFTDENQKVFQTSLGSQQQESFFAFQNTASTLSSSSDPLSRYHSSKYKQVSSQYVYKYHHKSSTLSRADERTMNWEEDDFNQGEEHDDEEEDKYYKQRNQELATQRWNKQEIQWSNDMYDAWESFTGSSSTSVVKDQGSQISKEGGMSDKHGSVPVRNALLSLEWMHFFMPPHPSMNIFACQLPFNSIRSSNAENFPFFHSFHCGYDTSNTYCSTKDLTNITTEWKENQLLDKLRKWMEECDRIRGFHLNVDFDQAFFAGLATMMLEEIMDECKSAVKFSIAFHEGDSFLLNEESVDEVDDSYWRSERKVVQSFRNNLNQGIALHGAAEHSDLVLPISLRRCWKSLHKQDEVKSLFEASAMAALALENISLPYRLSSSTGSRAKIGINSGTFYGSGDSGNDMFSTTDKLSFHEFVTCMKPSNKHIFTEVNTSQMNRPSNLHSKLLEGTSIERRQMEQEREINRSNSMYKRTRPRDVDPGLWMEDEGSEGLLTPLLPLLDSISSSQSLQDHFALSSTFRCLPSNVGDVTATYTTCLMEGMGVRYRPQSSIAVVAAQTLDGMIGFPSCPSGIYWKQILGPSLNTNQGLSVLGNTTRIHSHLSSVSSSFKSALSRKHMGYFHRDMVAGLVPESEDCTNALESCLAFRDAYEPKTSAWDEEGDYFSDNTE